jgi:hypothetical protein
MFRSSVICLCVDVIVVFIIIMIIIILLLTAIEFSTGGSSPYTSTDKTNKNKVDINETIQKHSTNNTKHSKHKCTYYQNTHTTFKTPPQTLTHILQKKLKQAQYKNHTK